MLEGLIVLLAVLIPDESEGMAARLAVVGDVDSDGVSDVAVASRAGLVGRDAAGRVPGPPKSTEDYNPQPVWVLSGRDGELISVLEDDGSPGFGSVVCCAGDVNRDGIPDVAVGNGLSILEKREWPGRVVIYCGLTGRRLHSVDAGSLLRGRAVPLAHGDLNGDGEDELVVGDPLAGRIGVFGGQMLGSKREFEAGGGDCFGHALCVVSDRNGDGVNDLLAARRGSLLLLCGRCGGRLLSMDAAGPSLPRDTLSPGNMVWSCGDAGDFDGDGIRDFLGTSANNWVRLWRGSDGTVLREVSWVGGNYRGEGTSYAVLVADKRAEKTAVLIGYNEGYMALWSRGGVLAITRDGAHELEASELRGIDGYDLTGLGDVNGDGIMDVAVATRVSNELRVLSGGDFALIYRTKLVGLPLASGWDEGK